MTKSSINQNGFLNIIIALIVFAVIAGGGVYFVVKNQEVVVSTPANSVLSFEDIVKKNCIKDEREEFSWIDINSLSISFPPQINADFIGDYGLKDHLSCGGDHPNYDLLIPYPIGLSHLFIYTDRHSKSYSETSISTNIFISEEDNVNYYAYLSGKMEPVFPNNAYLYIRGVKSLVLDSGEKIYVDIHRLVPENHTTMHDLLIHYCPDNFTEACEYTSYNPAIKEKYFEDVNNLAIPEKEAMNYLRNIFAGIEVK